MIGDDLIDQILWKNRVQRRRHAVKFVRGLFVYAAFFALLQLAFQLSLDVVASFVVGRPLNLPLVEWQRVFAAALVTGVLGSLAVGFVFYSALGLFPKGTRREYLERQLSSPFGGPLSEHEYRELVAGKAETANAMEGARQLGWDLEQAIEESLAGPDRRKDRTTLGACWNVLCYSSHTPDFERAMADSDDWQDLLYEMAQQAYAADVRTAVEQVGSE